VDTFLHSNDQLRGILNSGYHRKTAFVLRAAPSSAANEEPDDESSAVPGAVKRYSCWCPKALAKIGRFPDTLADRCILIRMQRKTPDEVCDRSKQLDADPLKRQCARFVLDHAAEIAAARPAIPPVLNDRAADIWEPLLALADIAGGDWPEMARQAAISLSASTREQSPVTSLLVYIFALFTINQSDRIFTRELVDGLNSFADRRWAELRNGKKITDIWLSQQLRPYGIKPRTIWAGGNSAKGYFQEDFVDVFRRYVTKSDVNACLGQPPDEPRATGNGSNSAVPLPAADAL
jgi:hypothetical protein